VSPGYIFIAPRRQGTKKNIFQVSTNWRALRLRASYRFSDFGIKDSIENFKMSLVPFIAQSWGNNVQLPCGISANHDGSAEYYFLAAIP
jgi:hypothetical protein